MAKDNQPTDSAPEPQNDLAVALSKIPQANKSKLLLYAVAVAAGIGLIYFLTYTRRLGEQTDAGRWLDLDVATNKEGLKELMERYSGKLPGQVAKLRLARLILQEDGLEKLATTDAKARLAAANSVDEAKKLFLDLPAAFKDQPMLAQEAWLNAALAEESVIGIPKSDTDKSSRGDLDAALKFMENAAKILPESEASKAITKQIEEKKKNKDKIIQFYTDIQNQLIVETSLPKLDLETKPGQTAPSTPAASSTEKKLELTIPEKKMDVETGKTQDASPPKTPNSPELKTPELKTPDLPGSKTEPKAPVTGKTDGK